MEEVISKQAQKANFKLIVFNMLVKILATIITPLTPKLST